MASVFSLVCNFYQRKDKETALFLEGLISVIVLLFISLVK
jgi:hypothetical protein